MTPLEASGDERASLLGDAARPFSARGLAVAAVAAAPALLSPLGPSASWAVVAGAGTAVAYLMAVTHVARGRAGFLVPVPGARRAAPIAVAGRAFALYVLAAFPFVAAVAASPATASPTDVLAAMLATSLYLPAAIGAVVASGHGATAFWPFAWMRVIGTIGPFAYGRACMVFAAGVLGAWSLDQGLSSLATKLAPAALAEGALALPYASATAFARTWLVDLVWLAQACALGALLRRERDGLGL